MYKYIYLFEQRKIALRPMQITTKIEFDCAIEGLCK